MRDPCYNPYVTGSSRDYEDDYDDYFVNTSQKMRKRQVESSMTDGERGLERLLSKDNQIEAVRVRNIDYKY